jgi:hypothetical protein
MKTQTFQNVGIYTIVNTITKETYIGSSTNLGNRKTKHFSLLKHNKSLNTKLQEAVTKYGIINFEFDILEYCKEDSTRNFLREREQIYIEKYKPVYNIYTDLKHSTVPLESRLKMSNTRKALYSEGKLKTNCAKTIIQTDLENYYIESYPSIRKASVALDIHVTSIERVLYGKYKQMKGFVFHYENSDLIKYR